MNPPFTTRKAGLIFELLGKMPFNPERITLPLYDENGNSLPGCSDRPQLRLAAMMWHLAAQDEPERLREVLLVAARQGLDWSHRGARNGMGASPLLVAALHGHTQCVRYMLEAYRLPTTTVDLSDSFGNSPLMAAVCRGRVACVQLLLDALANPNHRNAQGYSCLEAAVEFARVECTRLLLQAGAIPSQPPTTHKRPTSRAPDGSGLPLTQWERRGSLQWWYHEPTLPAQTKAAHQLNAQLIKHTLGGPDVTLLETPLDRFETVSRRHAARRELENHRAQAVHERARRREEELEAHRQRVERAALRPQFG